MYFRVIEPSFSDTFFSASLILNTAPGCETEHVAFLPVLDLNVIFAVLVALLLDATDTFTYPFSRLVIFNQLLLLVAVTFSLHIYGIVSIYAPASETEYVSMVTMPPFQFTYCGACGVA